MTTQMYGNGVLLLDEATFEVVADILTFNVEQTRKALARERNIPSYDFDDVWFYCEETPEGMAAHWRAYGV